MDPCELRVSLVYTEFQDGQGLELSPLSLLPGQCWDDGVGHHYLCTLGSARPQSSPLALSDPDSSLFLETVTVGGVCAYFRPNFKF